MKRLLLILLIFLPLEIGAQLQSIDEFLIKQRASKSEFNTKIFIECVYFFCREPEYVLAQSVHETGWFKSYNCIYRNNYFGMKLSNNGYARRSDGMYAFYNHWFDSLLDYAEWQRTFYSGQDYLEFLRKRGYAEDPKYITKIANLMSSEIFKQLILNDKTIKL